MRVAGEGAQSRMPFTSAQFAAVANQKGIDFYELRIERMGLAGPSVWLGLAIGNWQLATGQLFAMVAASLVQIFVFKRNVPPSDARSERKLLINGAIGKGLSRGGKAAGRSL